MNANVLTLTQKSAVQSPTLEILPHNPPDLLGERILFWTVALVPLWWILGIQLMVYPVVGWFLLYRSWQCPRVTPLPLGWYIWWLYALVYFSSTILNLCLGVAEIGRSLNAMGAILGIWMLFLIVWYAMRRLGVRLQVVVRALCIVGLCQLVAVILGQLHVAMTGNLLETQSLLVQMVPRMPARVFFEAQLYGWDRVSWGEYTPRLKSFYYWSPLAGTMSIFICMAAWMEQKLFWRVAGFLGGAVTIWFAAARAAQIGIIAAVLVTLWFAKGWGRKVLLWGSIPVILAAPVLGDLIHHYLFEYRGDSADGRFALYREAYEAFTQSPWLGYGTYGRSSTLDVPLGSHSQIYSTLYQTGVIGSCVLVAAWIAITLMLSQKVLKHEALSPTLGAWIGMTLQMPTGEFSGASVTVFALAALLGCTWNQAEVLTVRARMSWIPCSHLREPPTPWQALHSWWTGTPWRHSIENS